MGLKKKLKNKALGYKATSDSYIAQLRRSGVKVGTDVKFFRPYNTTIDMQNPHLLTIGDHVMITGPVTVLTHDYSWSVLKNKYGYVAGNQKPVKIGNNVFIGWGATILAGTTVGDNTIIGANSVVSGRLESDSVYAGNPAKRIMSIDEYYRKRLSRQLDEAYGVVCEYKKRRGEYPPAEILDEYFFLFTGGNTDDLPEAYLTKLRLMGTYEESMELLRNNKPQFDGYDSFIEYCVNRKKDDCYRKTETTNEI